MNKMRRPLLFILIASIISISAACTAQNDKQTFLTGKITVADSLDTSRNYSDIYLTIFKRDTSARSGIDTLFSTRTNPRGEFSGIFEYETEGRYPMLIGRYGYDIGLIDILISDGDTVRITGELPDVASTFEVDSKETRAMNALNRIRGSFDRVLLFINAGQVAEEDIANEYAKFGDLFWSIYEDKKGTVASNYAASEAFRIYDSIQADSLLDEIISANLNDVVIQNLAIEYGTSMKARTGGLESVVEYLDMLKENIDDFDRQMFIDQKRVNVLYDSMEVEQAKEAFEYFKRRYKRNKDISLWIALFEREIENLAPGMKMPSFTFVSVDGDTINTNASNGNPRLYEFAQLTDPFYQEEYERMKALALVYSSYNIEFLSIPVRESQVAMNAFYEERGRTGPLLNRDSYDTAELIESFNLTDLPSWILVDREGNIIRKYVREEISDITNGFTKAIN